MSILRILVPPLTGAVIGYVTNYIAIKMLFRPLTPKYLFGFRLPFTPGIVPRNQRRLADALGKAVFAKFFNWDDLEVVFLSDAFVSEVTDRLVRAFRSERTLGEAFGGAPEGTADALSAAVCARIAERIAESGAVAELVRKGAAALSDNAGSSSGVSSLLGSFAEAYAGPVSQRLEAYVREHGTELLLPVVRAERRAAADTSLEAFTRSLFGEDDAALRAGIREVYLRFMRENVRPIVESVDIVTQITEKMNQMSAGEVESLALDIVARELRLVVCFGALLGAAIGAVNIWFMS